MNTHFDSKLNFLEIFHDFKQSGVASQNTIVVDYNPLQNAVVLNR